MTSELKEGSKQWWWTAKRLMGEGGKCGIPLLTLDDQTFISSDQKAECFAEIFSEKSTIPKEENDREVPKVSRKTHASLKKKASDALDLRQESRLICLDISRAFDRVWHKGLIAKLAALGLKADKCKRITISRKHDAADSYPPLVFMDTILTEVDEVELLEKFDALTLLHRMYHREASTLLNDLVSKHKEVRRVTRQSKSHHENTLAVPVSHTNSHMRTFVLTTVKLWNSLPREIAKIRDRKRFKPCSGTYGPDCNTTCGHCYGSQNCDRFDGRCPNGWFSVCAAGYNGDKCDQECPDGLYGADCTRTCHCAAGPTVCNKTTGFCTGGCLDLWAGDSCQILKAYNDIDTDECARRCLQGYGSYDGVNPTCLSFNHRPAGSPEGGSARCWLSSSDKDTAASPGPEWDSWPYRNYYQRKHVSSWVDHDIVPPPKQSHMRGFLIFLAPPTDYQTIYSSSAADFKAHHKRVWKESDKLGSRRSAPVSPVISARRPAGQRPCPRSSRPDFPPVSARVPGHLGPTSRRSAPVSPVISSRRPAGQRPCPRSSRPDFPPVASFYILAPKDCTDLIALGIQYSHVYTIGHPQPFQAYCDMGTYGGGWTVIQRRQDGSVPFNKTWIEYEQGFGNTSGEYWLGLGHIHSLTTQKPNELYVYLEDWERNSRLARYSTFSVGYARSKYTATIGGYSGDNSYYDNLDSPHSSIDNRKFSTTDQDNDGGSTDCAGTYGQGGWWYPPSCGYALLNGQYLTGCSSSCSYGDGIVWYTWRGYSYSLKKTVIMVRPANFPASPFKQCQNGGNLTQGPQDSGLFICVCADGWYGAFCDQECGHCYIGQTCSKFYGACPTGESHVCASGYHGSKCDQECSSSFGPDCNTTCGHCYMGRTCDRFTGTCPTGEAFVCSAGYNGHKCDSECPDGLYGAGCTQTCHCAAGPAACDKPTGVCTGGCHDLWTGDSCQTREDTLSYEDLFIKKEGRFFGDSPDHITDYNDIDTEECARRCLQGYGSYDGVNPTCLSFNHRPAGSPEGGSARCWLSSSDTDTAASPGPEWDSLPYRNFYQRK
ncbi:hypothetical protein Bbelb_160410, partial [Branchiostoma belcheri]